MNIVEAEEGFLHREEKSLKRSKLQLHLWFTEQLYCQANTFHQGPTTHYMKQTNNHLLHIHIHTASARGAPTHRWAGYEVM